MKDTQATITLFLKSKGLTIIYYSPKGCSDFQIDFAKNVLGNMVKLSDSDLAEINTFTDLFNRS